MHPADKILLKFYRRVLDRIHQGGSIWYDEGRYDAYKTVALTASRLRTEVICKQPLTGAGENFQTARYGEPNPI